MNDTIYKTDRMIINDVIDELSWDPRISNSKIDVTSSAGIVTLDGLTPYNAHKIFAEEDARRVSGVRSVTNKIELEVT